MSLPYTLQNRPTGSTDPKYKADADEVMANLKYILNSVAFQKLEVDVSITSEELNCDTSNLEYGASITSQCNLIHILGESYGGMFLGKLSGGVAAGDKVGIRDTSGRCWIATLASDNQISFGEGSGGTAGKCTWERIDGGSAYASYNDTTWMNTLTIWHLARNTSLSNILFKILKSEILFSASLSNGVDAADIPLIDSGGYFTTDTIEFALAEFGLHKNTSTNPHGSTLTQTNLTVTGTTSLVTLNLSGNLAIGTTKFTVNATTGDVVIAGTLTGDGAVLFGSSLGALTLNIGGAASFGGTLTATTQITTPLIHRDGDLTLEAHSASAQTHIYLNNPDGTYDAVVHIDKHLQFDRLGSYIELLDIYPYANQFKLDIYSSTFDTVFYVLNSHADHKVVIYVEGGYAWGGIGTNAFTLDRPTATTMDWDLKDPEDTTLYLKNSTSGKKAHFDIQGNLNVQGIITGNFQAIFNYKNCLTVAKTGGQYSTIQSAINAITDAGVNNQYIVLIYPGNYVESIALKDYVHLVGIRKDACKITSSGSNSLTSTGTTNIVANLTIVTVSGSEYIFYSTAECTITFENCNFLDLGNGIYLSNSSGYIYIRNCHPVTGYVCGLNIANGKAEIYDSTLSYVEQTSANGQILAFASRFIGNRTNGPVYLTGTSFASQFRFCYIETTGTNQHAVTVSSNNHMFLNCILKANGSGNSLYAATAKTVIASGCTVNLDKHSNITVTPGSVWQTTNVLNAVI